MMIDWNSSESHLLLNPRLSESVKSQLIKALPCDREFAAHLWLMSSGSTGALDEHKCVALSKGAVLASAKAVNNHLQSCCSDVWINPLPNFHVGGLGISARAYLTGAKEIHFTGKWEPVQFYAALEATKATLTALVPAQLHDLISRNLASPPSLRCVVIGGGRLDEFLYQRAVALGWRVLPSYGLTEASSQVATAPYSGNDKGLVVLNHLQVRIGPQGAIEIAGPSLLTAYAYVADGRETLIHDPKEGGWLCTEDFGRLHEGKLEVVGRATDFVKIGGESVDIARLERLLEKFKAVSRSEQQTVLLAVSDERLGHVVHLAVQGEIQDATTVALEQYQQAVLPFERVRRIHAVEEIPRSELGKVKKSVLAALL